MNTKLKLRVGQVELEYEGSEPFSKAEILEFVRQLESTKPASPAKVTPLAPAAPLTELNATGLSTSTIAQKLGASTGPDLAKAALARLCLVLGREEAKRKDILEEMQTAKAYYSSNYSGNLSKALKRLVQDGVFNQTGADTYSLTLSTRAEISLKLDEQAAA